MNKEPSHLVSVFQALLVTLLWSSSFVIIKIGLSEIPPLVFAGLRYSIAFLVLLPLLLRKVNLEQIRRIKKKDWLKLILLGLIFYTFTQGAQFFGLSYLPSVTVSLILNFTPIVTATFGVFLLGEFLSLRQWMGSILFISGVLVYFYPVVFVGNQLTGIFIMLFAVFSNAGSAILGRYINRQKLFTPIVITGISMGIGSIFLLIPGIWLQGLPSISLTNFLLLLWMAIINTAFAFTLWNNTLRNLTAVDSSIINGTMLIQIGILSWIFLGEAISLQEAVGMLIAGAGVIIVQLRKTKIKT